MEALPPTVLPAGKWLLIAFELMARWYVCIFLNVYGWGKIFSGQFFRRGHLPDTVAHKTIDQLNGFETAWTFFGYASGYILFIGLAQVACALLLLPERTKLLGALLLIPILLNIIVVDLFYQIPQGALISACLYLLLLLYILFHSRKKLLTALRDLVGLPQKAPQPLVRQALLGVCVLAMAALLFYFELHFLRYLSW